MTTATRIDEAAALDVYEQGLRAEFESAFNKLPIADCPYAFGSDEAQIWHEAVNDARGDRLARNRKLRALRISVARKNGAHTARQWRELCAEFQGRCVRCGCFSTELQRDHIVPVYQRGSDCISNIQPLCPKCNTAKGSEDTNWAAYRRQHGF